MRVSLQRAHFRFYAQLNDFLPCEKRGVPFGHAFEVGGSVKDLIEALGVPHPEIDLILVNGVTVDCSCPVLDGDRISVYPRFQSIDVEPLTRVRPPLLPELRFASDTHLGRLARYLRMLGFDTLYCNDYRDEQLAELSGSQGRVLLSRDRGLLKRSAVTHGYFVRQTDPRRQLVEVARHFDLRHAMTPFQRCLRCNGLLQPALKQDVEPRLPPRTKQLYCEFHVCVACGRIYWKGSHYERMQRLIDRIFAGD
jgi:uncharacterized protein with PIN domain